MCRLFRTFITVHRFLTKRDDKTEGVVIFTYSSLSFVPIIDKSMVLSVMESKHCGYVSPDTKHELMGNLALATSFRVYLETSLFDICDDTREPTECVMSLYSLAYKIFLFSILCLKKSAIAMSIAVNWILVYSKCLNYIVIPLMSYSKFLTSVSKRLDEISKWTVTLGTLESQLDINKYLSTRNMLYNSIAIFYLDLITGICTFLFFKTGVLKMLFKLRSATKAYYLENLKSLFYFVTKRIGIYCKLNNEIGMSLSKFLVNKINLWYLVKPKVKLVTKILLKILQYSSILGISAQISLLLDIFLVETLHLVYIYIIILSIMNYTQKYLYSLVHLFKGKKWNVLKCILDTNNFTKEELFIGIVVFTVFALNYPTIWIFYFSVILTVLPILVVKTLLVITLEIVTKIPIYSLLCNLILPGTVKESIYFERIICEEGYKNAPLEIKPTQISLTRELAYISKVVSTRVNCILPMNILRKILACKNIFYDDVTADVAQPY